MACTTRECLGYSLFSKIKTFTELIHKVPHDNYDVVMMASCTEESDGISFYIPEIPFHTMNKAHRSQVHAIIVI